MITVQQKQLLLSGIKGDNGYTGIAFSESTETVTLDVAKPFQMIVDRIF